MRRLFLQFTAVLLVLVAAGIGDISSVGKAHAAEQIKVVYHMMEGIDQAARGMGNIRNHLRADPDTRIVVVAVGDGIQFLLKGATQRNGRAFDAQVSSLAAQGVEFRVCGNTLSAHDVAPSRLLPEATLVPSGVAEIARLQAHEKFAYLRP